MRDADAEKDSMHNLDVARQYFKLRKAYRAALSRCEEIIAANPTFSRLDETLYIAGMSSFFLSEKKGKQAPTADASTDKLREDARNYLSQLVEHFPDSTFRKDAEARLHELGTPKDKKQ